MEETNRNEAIEYIMGQLEDGYVDVGGVHEENEVAIIREAMSALICINQVRWERDVAIAQLNELGLGFGQKIEGVYLSQEEVKELLEYKQMYENLHQWVIDQYTN